MLEVIEISMESALKDNSIRFRFPAEIVPDVKVLEFEFQGHAYCCLIAATSSSLHRLLFPHPATLAANNISMFSQTSDAVFGFKRHHLFNLFKGNEATTITAVNSTHIIVGCANGSIFYEQMQEVDGLFTFHIILYVSANFM